METYELQPVPGHLVFSVDGRAVLLDTGAPYSFGSGPTVTLAGRPWPVKRDELGLMIRIIALLGRPVDVVLGTDVLGAIPFLVDGPAHRVTFGVDLAADGRAVPVGLRWGIPEVTLERRGMAEPALLDTGALLCYAPPGAVTGRAPDGGADDYHPLVGTFTVPTYRHDVVVASRPFSAQFGVLPAQLAPLRTVIGDRWILGVEFFRERRVLLDLAGRRALDLTPDAGS